MKKSLSVFVTMLLAALMIAFTDARTITGRVTDAQGQPIAGVMVRVKGSSNPSNVVITGTDGNFKITVEKNADILVFSLTGFSQVEERAGERRIINIIMTSATVELKESEPLGYAAKKDRSSSSYDMMSPSSVGRTNSGSFHRYNNNFNTEGYASVNESGFRNVKNNPLSTFSIDVDNASYSNVRRFINMGELPPEDAVRIEEMINYFKYEYPDPHGEHPFSVYTEMTICPWNTSHRLLQVGLRAKNIDKSSLPPSNLVFLIDVSGSMIDPNKLPLLKSAFSLLVNELRQIDRVAIVVYAGAAGLVLESTPGNRKEIILSAIDNLEAGGSTAGGAGLKLAYAVAERNFIKGGNNRIILATDGDFNVGVSSNGGIERLVEEKREMGIFITVLGFGMGNVKDDKMELIADKGNGNYSYIDNLQEARKVLVKEFGGTLFTIAKDVKFQIEFNPVKVSSYRLVGYENRLLNDEDFNDDTKDAGDMGSGHNVTALYELVPAGNDEYRPAVDPLRYQSQSERRNRKFMDYDSDNDNSLSSEYLTIKIRYKKPDGHTSMVMEKQVTGSSRQISEASDNIKFAAAVSEFGMILRNSEFKGTATLEGASRLAKTALGYDDEGYRAEFVRLVNTVKSMRTIADR